MERPTFKQIVILNLVNNIPMAIVMSITAPIVAGMPLEPVNLVKNIILAFLLACILNSILPIPLMSIKIPQKFGKDPNSFIGRFIANIPIAFLFVLIIGLILTFYNVRKFPDFVFAFIFTFLPLYIICFIIAMITVPIANKLAFEKK